MYSRCMRFPYTTASWNRRLSRKIVSHTSTQSTEGLQTDEDPRDDTSFFSQLMHLKEKQKEIQREEERKKAAEKSVELSSQAPPSTTVADYVDIDETSPQRAAYHNQLFVAAKKGDTITAEDVIREMVADGFQPGPCAYHALVFAYVKKRSAAGALTAIRRAHASGARPLTESYVVLIYAFMKSKNTKNAEAVFTSMLRPNANADAEKGWIMLVTMLFRQGFESKAVAYLEEGRQESFTPDRHLYACIIDYYCRNHHYEHALEELSEVLVFERDERSDIYCEPQHIAGLLEHYGEKGDIQMSLWLMSLPRSLDLPTYNSVLHAIVNGWDQEGIQSRALFDNVWQSLTDSQDIDPDDESLLIYVKALLKIGEVLIAQQTFVSNQLAGVDEKRQFDYMQQRVLPPLFQGLVKAELPIRLHSVLLSMAFNRCSALPDDVMVPDANGRTFVSQWIEHHKEKLLAKRIEVGEKPYHDGFVFTKDGRQAEVINGVKIGYAKCAVDDDGMILSMSRMKIGDLIAECIARDLPTEGLRKELQAAVTKARRANPSIADELKRRKALRRRQKTMRGGPLENKARPYGRPAKEPTETYEYVRYEYANGKLISKKKMPAEEAEALLARPRFTVEKAEAETLEDLRKLNEKDFMDALRVDDTKKKKPMKWSDTYTLESQQYSDMGSDDTAGANAAIAICERVSLLGSFPTLEDFEAIDDLNRLEKSAMAAWKLGIMIQQKPVEFKAADPEPEKRVVEYRRRMLDILHSCCRLCLLTGFPDACEEIIEDMEVKGLQPTPELLEEIKIVREKGPLLNTEVPMGGADFLASPEDLIPQPDLLEEDEPEVVELDSPIGPPSTDEEESLEGFSSMNNMDDSDEDIKERDEELDELIATADATAVAEPDETAVAEPDETAVAEPDATAVAEPDATADAAKQL